MSNLEFKKRVLFIGVPDMAYIGLDTLYYAGVNIVGVMGPLKSHNTYYPFKHFVKSRNLNFIKYDDLNSVDFLNYIKSLNIDIAVVCSYNHKIPKIFIDCIKDGILNIHPSLLPKYRGGNPYSRVIMNGECETGVTIHFMSENFDEGDIVLQEKCEILPNETMGTLFHKTNKLGSKLLLASLIQYEKTGTLNRITQPKGEFIKAPNVKDYEMLINFNNSAIEIDRLVRSLNPYMCAYSIFNNLPVKFFKVTVINEVTPSELENGTIYKIENNKIYIKTSSGAIIPEIIQYAGLFIGGCNDFLNHVKVKIGDKFGNG